MKTQSLLGENSHGPVCVTGMHRSGTSTVSQILFRLGLDLGDEEDLFRGNVHNQDGYFENKHFVGLNQHLLAGMGYGWDYPPPADVNWEDAGDVEDIVEASNELIERFEARNALSGDRWGWKDPRNSVTMPFWLSLRPDIRVVASLRNPLEVVASLHRRGNASPRFGMNLWKIYNTRLLETVPEERLLIVSYDRLFLYPQAEIRRILDFVGMNASDQLISLVRSRVIRGLRHHVYTREDILSEDPTGEIDELYSDLCRRATERPDLSSTRRKGVPTE